MRVARTPISTFALKSRNIDIGCNGSVDNSFNCGCKSEINFPFGIIAFALRRSKAVMVGVGGDLRS